MNGRRHRRRRSSPGRVHQPDGGGAAGQASSTPKGVVYTPPQRRSHRIGALFQANSLHHQSAGSNGKQGRGFKRKGACQRKAASNKAKRVRRRKGWYTVPTDSEYQLVKQVMSCTHDAVIFAARKLGVGNIVTQPALYKALPPKKTVGRSLQDVAKTSCVSSSLYFTEENYCNAEGGPEFAVICAAVANPF